MRNLSLLLLILTALPVSISVFGQSQAGVHLRSRTKNHQEQWEAGILAGISLYRGDLSTKNIRMSNGGGGGGLFTRYRFNDAIAARANLQFGSLKGDDGNFEDVGRRIRNFSFRSNFYDFGLLLEAEPLGKWRINHSGTSRHFVSPYIHFGISGILSVPLVDFNEPNIVVKYSDINCDKSSASFFHLAIPIGAGLRYDLNNNWMLGAEAGVRPVFTDYLDGISKAGNPAKKDWIGTANLILGYRFAAYRDKDGDGIPNDLDACPLEAGTRKTKGCPDRDKDGIADNVDRCPDTAGSEKMMGCPDADEDGVEDSVDECPNESGAIDLKGCPDKDGDGTPDHRDNCPDKPGAAIHAGCPDTSVVVAEKMRSDSLQREIEATEAKQKQTSETEKLFSGNAISFLPESADNQLISSELIQLLKEAEAGIVFDKNSSLIKPESKIYLNRIAKLLEKQPGYRLRIIGHTEKIGKELQNVVLSVSRARAVYEYLLGEGIDFRKLSFVGSGSAR